ncbi:hypothetical protein BD410DRAFT_789176 [Rickenella mellea]|uniref:Uncharacterized protein n=1 Tax=Rickenella mellea TaxID=50990 RepID=A0A4Y7Q2D0_9AGAM|nr:hypothetical protein BD410DRAFT_789176 [Rickenella mellea]
MQEPGHKPSLLTKNEVNFTLMNNLTVGKLLGVVAANVASVTTGIDASTEVAARCLGGRSLGQLFVFHSTFEFDCRYQGMRKAFGEETEIFRMVGSHSPSLESADYDKLVNASFTTSSKPATLNTEEPNRYLCVHANLPIINWGREVHLPLVTVVYTVVALGAMPAIAFTRCIIGVIGILEALYFVTFSIINGFTFFMLDVQREVCYIPITEEDVSASVRITLRGLTSRTPDGLPATTNGALQDLRRGSVRTHNGTLHIPVIAVRTRVEDDPASWLLLLNLYGPVMSLGLFFLPDTHVNWGVAYGIAAYTQARLQRAVAERYVKDAKTRGVFWFRKSKHHRHEGMHVYPLDVNIFKGLMDSPFTAHVMSGESGKVPAKAAGHGSFV